MIDGTIPARLHVVEHRLGECLGIIRVGKFRAEFPALNKHDAHTQAEDICQRLRVPLAPHVDMTGPEGDA